MLVPCKAIILTKFKIMSSHVHTRAIDIYVIFQKYQLF